MLAGAVLAALSRSATTTPEDAAIGEADWYSAERARDGYIDVSVCLRGHTGRSDVGQQCCSMGLAKAPTV